MPAIEKMQNATLTAAYLRALLLDHGFKEDAQKLEMVDIQSPADASTVEQILQHMQQFRNQEIADARAVLRERLRTCATA